VSREPTRAEVTNAAIEHALEGLRKCTPARVTAYDSTRQTVDAQPLIKERHYDENGQAVVEAVPVVCAVPVVFPGGAGFTVTFPIEVGDTVLLVFSDVSLDKWSVSAGAGPVDPESYARHSLSDAVAIPGLRNFRNARASAPTSTLRIGADGGTPHAAALGDVLQSFLTSLRTLFNAHVHTGVTTGPGSSGPPATPMSAVPTVTSATVEVTE